jgi:hypothetical protein
VTLDRRAQLARLLVLERVGDEVLDAHHLGRAVAVDVEDVVERRLVVVDVDPRQLRRLGREELPQLGDVAGVHVRAAVRHRPARQEPEVAERPAVAAAAIDRSPRRREEGRALRLHLPPQRVEGIVHVGADVHVRQPRRVAVRLVGRNVIDRERPLVRGERAKARRRVRRDAAAVPRRVLVPCADRIDRGELVEGERVAAHGIAIARHAREEREKRGTQLGGRRTGRRVRDERIHVRRDARCELGHPQAVRQHQVHQLEPPRLVEAPAVLGTELRRPAPHDLVDGHADAEHAPGVQALEQVQVSRAERIGPQRRLGSHELLELHVAQARREVVEGAVLREDEPAGVGERAVGAPAL